MALSITATHVLQGVQYTPSPNFDARPPACQLDLIVIHSTSIPPGEFQAETIRRFFCNEALDSKHPYADYIAPLQVSSHILIDRQGEITQFVPFDKRAWHAGQSNYQGRDRCNDFSIGIELAGWDYCLFSKAQYQALALVCQALMAYYPAITHNNIVAHSDISPGRKSDPGPYFAWDHLQALVNKDDKA